MMKRSVSLIILLLFFCVSQAQVLKDSVQKPVKLADHHAPSSYAYEDTVLRIINLNPFFSLHVDSSLSYQLLINKPVKNYYWYLKDAPTGLRVDKDQGILLFKANKSLFMSGRLKYDTKYPVKIGVQSLSNPNDRVDTSFTITFYSTDVVYPRLKPSVVSPVTIEEGTRLNFPILCENGNFAIDKILVSSNISIGNFKLPKACDDNFDWTPGYDFVNERDSGKVKIVNLMFIGTTQFNFVDTAMIKVIVRDGLNYDIANEEYKRVDSSIKRWIKQLKLTFIQLDKKIKNNKGWRSGFDITTAGATTTGTVLSTTISDNKVATPKVLTGTGVIALPIKEAVAPQKTVEQNQASLVRSTVKRLEYILTDNQLQGDRDPNVAAKTETLRKELRQSQTQLAEVPTEASEYLTDEQLERKFNSPKVQRKYRLR